MGGLGKENFLSQQNLVAEKQVLKQYCTPSLISSDFQRNRHNTKQIWNSNSNLRVGDWICLICNNLNFSFRDECNRCQIQTKRRNYFESVRFISEKKNIDTESINRKPLRDLTNHSNYSTDVCSKTSFSPSMTDYQLKSEDKSSIIGNFIANRNIDYEPSADSCFKNMLLLPSLDEVDLISKDCLDANEVDFHPYNSPKQLPSVTPILKSVVQHNYKRGNLIISDELSKSSWNYAKDYIKISNREQKVQESSLGIDKYRVDEDITHGDDDEYLNQNIDRLLADENIDSALIQSSNQEKRSDKTIRNPWIHDFNIGESQGKQEIVKHDWVCRTCGNLNYSFRKCCNRCQKQK